MPKPNFFLLSLEATARRAGIKTPVVRVEHDGWTLYDEVSTAGVIFLVKIALFSSGVDIANRITDESAKYVLRQQLREGAPR